MQFLKAFFAGLPNQMQFDIKFFHFLLLLLLEKKQNVQASTRTRLLTATSLPPVVIFTH